MDGDTLTEQHIRLDEKGEPQPGEQQNGETYRYTINDEGKLVLVSKLDVF